MAAPRKWRQLVELLAGLKIPAGAGEGKVLTSDASGNATWAVPLVESSIAIAYRSAAQKFKNNTSERIKFDKAAKDPGSNLELTNGYYVVPAEGFYSVYGAIRWEAKFPNAALNIFVNGTIASAGQQALSNNVSMLASGIVFCKKGDHIELWAFQESGEELTIGNTEQYVRMAVARVGAGPQGATGIGGPNEHGRSAEMVSGKITIAAPAVTATGTILVSVEGTVALAGILAITKRNVGESFVVESSLVTSTDRVNWAVWV
jgi:hypothetical protein